MRPMSPSQVVLLIAIVTFAFGTASVAVFGPLEERRQLGALGWLVRGLVGLAVAHTGVGIYHAVEHARGTRDVSASLRAADLSTTVMGMMVYGGVLLALAALLHLWIERDATEREPPP
jgi:hypothetical protein